MPKEVNTPAPIERVPEGAEFYHGFWKEYTARLNRRAKISAEQQEQVFVEFHSDILAEVFGRAPGTLVANFGCGQGTHSVPMERRGFRVVNLEFSSEALALTRQYYDRSGIKPLLVRCDILHPPFADESFDVIMSFGVIEHFCDIRTPFEEMARVLKRGGVFHAEIVTRRLSLRSLDIFLSAAMYTAYNLLFLRWSKIRGISRGAHLGEDFFENTYPLSDYVRALSASGIQDLRSFGVRPFLMIAIPPWMDRLYARFLRALVPCLWAVTLSGSALTKRLCPVWLVYGRK